MLNHSAHLWRVYEGEFWDAGNALFLDLGSDYTVRSL